MKFVNVTARVDSLKQGELMIVDNIIVTIESVTKESGEYAWLIEYSYWSVNGVKREGYKYMQPELIDPNSFVVDLVEVEQ